MNKLTNLNLKKIYGKELNCLQVCNLKVFPIIILSLNLHHIIIYIGQVKSMLPRGKCYEKISIAY